MLFISWVLLAAPILTFQFYLERKTGELTKLKNVDELLNHKQTMYYSIENSFQYKNKSVLFVAKALVDRGNEIGVGCYFACPLTTNNDSTNISKVWIGVMFGDKFSNRVFDNKEKQAKSIEKFIDSSIALYDKYKYKTSFLKRLSNSDEKDYYLKAIEQTNLSLDKENLIILKEEGGNYESRAGTSLWWTIFFIIISNIAWTLLTMLTKLKPHGKKKDQ